MIDYATIFPGDKLRIVGMGAPGFAKLGDIVEVVACNLMNRCHVKREDGETAYFALTCGAQRLERVESSGSRLADATNNPPSDPGTEQREAGFAGLAPASAPCPHAPTYDAGLCCGHPDDCTFVSPSNLSKEESDA